MQTKEEYLIYLNHKRSSVMSWHKQRAAPALEVDSPPQPVPVRDASEIGRTRKGKRNIMSLPATPVARPSSPPHFPSPLPPLPTSTSADVLDGESGDAADRLVQGW